MGNRLGVRSSHTPEKSMAQRQSFPVHKKQQKLAPCVTTHGASFFPVQGLPRCKPIYDFPLPGTCCRLFYRPRRGVCHLQATRGALYVFSGARIGMDDPRLFSAFCKLRKDRPAFSDTRVSFLRFPWRTESIPPRRGGSRPAPPRGSRAPCNAPVALRPTTQPGNIP